MQTNQQVTSPEDGVRSADHCLFIPLWHALKRINLPRTMCRFWLTRMLSDRLGSGRRGKGNKQTRRSNSSLILPKNRRLHRVRWRWSEDVGLGGCRPPQPKKTPLRQHLSGVFFFSQFHSR